MISFDQQWPLMRHDVPCCLHFHTKRCEAHQRSLALGCCDNALTTIVYMYINGDRIMEGICEAVIEVYVQLYG